MNPHEAPRRSSLATVAIVVGGVAVMCCLGSVAIALPNFLKFNVRAKQAEVKSHLKAAWRAEQAYFAAHDGYSESLEQIGFLPERGNRYLYLVSPRGAVLTPGTPGPGDHSIFEVDPRMASSLKTAALIAAIPSGVLAQAGVHGACPQACQVTIVAVGNLDNDPGLDVWSISTESRTFAGEVVAAGVPFQHVDDVR